MYKKEAKTPYNKHYENKRSYYIKYHHLLTSKVTNSPPPSPFRFILSLALVINVCYKFGAISTAGRSYLCIFYRHHLFLLHSIGNLYNCWTTYISFCSFLHRKWLCGRHKFYLRTVISIRNEKSHYLIISGRHSHK